MTCIGTLGLVTRSKRYMKELFRNFLSFSSLERKGVIVLIIIIMIITGINAILVHQGPLLKKENNALFLKELQSFDQQLTVLNDSFIDLNPVFRDEEIYKGELFIFDPNSSSAGDFRRLGMNNRLIRTLLNYRLHGGRFHKKEDLNKLYGMNKGLYERLAPYVSIKEPSIAHNELGSSISSVPSVPVDINTADSAALDKLRGIGTILSKRIVRYRTLLGGFYDTGQLKEVYGLSDSLLSAIKPRFYADTTIIFKLSLNNASESELARHPYIGKYIKCLYNYNTITYI
jgi:competence protein ComEA